MEKYNYLQTKTKPCEIDLIKEDMNHVDTLLEEAINVATWREYNQNYINYLADYIDKLHSKISETQKNLKQLQSNIKLWGEIPLYTRKDCRTDTFLNIDDRKASRDKRHNQCQETSNLIKVIIEKNFYLFFSHSEDGEKLDEFQMRNEKLQYSLFRPYECYVDQFVLGEITDAVNNSFKYILFEMDNRFNHNSPVFEVKMDLQNTEICFIPKLIGTDDDSFNYLVDSIMRDIYKMATRIKRVVPSEGEEFIEENYDGNNI